MSLSDREKCVISWLERLIVEMTDARNKLDKKIHRVYEFNFHDKKAVDKFLSKTADQLIKESDLLMRERSILSLAISDIVGRITIIKLMADDREANNSITER